MSAEGVIYPPSANKQIKHSSRLQPRLKAGAKYKRTNGVRSLGDPALKCGAAMRSDVNGYDLFLLFFYSISILSAYGGFAKAKTQGQAGRRVNPRNKLDSRFRGNDK